MEDFSVLTPEERNLARKAFLSPERAYPLYRVSDQTEFRHQVVMQLRDTLTRYPTDPAVVGLIEDLREGSPEFERLWQRHDVQAAPMLTKTFRHPSVGDVTVDCDSLALTDRDQHLVLYSAPQGSRDAEALALLNVLGPRRPRRQATVGASGPDPPPGPIRRLGIKSWSPVRADQAAPDRTTPGRMLLVTDAPDREGLAQGDRVMDAMRVFSSDFSDITVQLARWLGVHTADATAFSEIIYAQESGEPLTPVKLSRKIGLTSGATTSLLNRLEDAGLIIRSREHTDRRRVTLRATPDIARAAKAVFDPVNERVDGMMDQYPPEFLKDVESLLDHLHVALQDAVRALQEMEPRRPLPPPRPGSQ